MSMQRLLLLRLLLLLVVFALVGRLYQLQMVDSDARRYGSTIEDVTTRYVPVPPRRGEILARDGKTLLAESVPIFNVAVLPGSLPPPATERRAQVLGQLAQMVELTSTLTLAPAHWLQQSPALRRDLAQVTTLDNVIAPDPQLAVRHSDVLTLTVPPEYTLDAIKLTGVYSHVLNFDNPIEPLIDRSNVPGYQTVIVKEDIPQEMALALRENSTHLPGVVVVQDYRRRYPQSGRVESFSHLLGYIGRISECELVAENPAPFWVSSLMDTVSHVVNCPRLEKEINPGVLTRGMPPYRHDDRIGKDGLEGSYEAELRGEMGVNSVSVDNLERPVDALLTEIPVLDGHNLVLTIDLEFQYQVETIMRRWIAESERRRSVAGGHKSEYDPITSGVAIVMNPQDGQVLAMVSLPTYDNNVWVDPDRSEDLQNILYPDDPEAREELFRLAPLTNRAIAGRYPPGSTFKQFVGAVALQKGVVTPDTRLYDPGVLVLEERSGTLFVLPNSSRRNNGEITISDAMMVSSNVFFASIAGGNDQATNLRPDDTRIDGLRISGLAEGLDWFGFGEPTGVRLSGEVAGRVPTPNWKSHVLREPWTTGDTYNMAIGQGYMEVTPLQLVKAASAIATDGTIYQPQLVQTITDSSGNVVTEVQPEAVGRIPVDPAYLAVMREGMRRSITEGINVAARDDCSGLRIAGKTGTAEFGPNIETATGDITRQSHSWFVGFAPYEDPQVAVVVLLEGTGDLNDGSATLAVPAVTQIMQTYFNVTPPTETPWDCPALPT